MVYGRFKNFDRTIVCCTTKNEYLGGHNFAHGYLVLSDTAEFLYKCTDYYDPADQRSIAWDDPELAISWNLTTPILSEKDRHAPRLKQLSAEELPR